MSLKLTPMRWPGQWQDPSTLALLRGTSINCLLHEDNGKLQPVISAARRSGLRVIEAKSSPQGVHVIGGVWPGIRMSQSGGRDEVSTGPTGVPWVNSNGWKVRLAAALNPQSAIWVDVAPETSPSGSYPLCFADSAACGGRWIISLDDRLAAGIQGGNRQAMETWQGLARATNFFAAHDSWSDYVGAAVVGVVSNFAGENEFFSHELLNLLTRTLAQYRIIPRTSFSIARMAGLRAVLYPDSDPPSPDVRKQLLDFVRSGGLLITRPEWGETPGNPATWDHPRYICRVLGRGRIAIAKSDSMDPYLLANDTVALVSHQYDLLRFWEAGAVNAYLDMGPDGKRALVQMVFYALKLNGRLRFGGPNTATVRVAGRYRAARLLTFDQSTHLATLTNPVSDKVGMEIMSDAVELHLPSLSHYAAVELSI